MIMMAQITIRDDTDVFISDAAPSAPVLDMLWLDTSVTPNLLKRWNGTAWIPCGADVNLDDYYTKTELNTRFSQTDDAIAFKADQTVTDNLGNRLSSAESSITAQAQQITSKVSQTEFENLTIGGRNLVRNSSLYTIAAGTDNYAYQSIYTGLKLNTQYALSIGHITLDVGTTIHITWRIYDLDTAINGAIGTLDISDARQSVVFTTPSDAGNWSLLLYAGVAGTTAENTVSFYQIKLEEGNKATAWTIAPEDIDENIQALNTATQTLSDDISETAQHVTQSVMDAVAEDYGTKQEVQIVSEALNSLVQQTAADIELVFQRARTYTVEVTGEMQQYIDVLQSYQRFSTDGLELGVLGSPFVARLGNTRLSFIQSGEEIAYISNNKLYITSAHVTKRLTIGNEENGGYFDWITTPNGLALKWRSA